MNVEETLFQLKLHGWCLIENVLPAAEVNGVRQSIDKPPSWRLCRQKANSYQSVRAWTRSAVRQAPVRWVRRSTAT